MARLYVCDRCQAKSMHWLECVEIPTALFGVHGKQMRVVPIFAWYVFWVGFFWDEKNSRLYIFPVPTLGIRIDFPNIRNPKENTCQRSKD